MFGQNTCVHQKDLSKQKIIKTYCYNVFKEMFSEDYDTHYEQPLSFILFFHQK